MERPEEGSPAPHGEPEQKEPQKEPEGTPPVETPPVASGE